MGKFCFGIDLGTTNSCIAVMQGVGQQRVPKVIKLRTGGVTLPSCVMFDHGEVIVGPQAYNNRYMTDKVVYSSKRDIGTDKVYHINDGATEFDVTPTDVAYHILSELKTSAELYYGEGAVDEIVITVPAYFNYEKRKRTKLAAERAGMKVLGIVNEPTAAALAYTFGSDKSDKFLVYDLGGGTFDVTILQMIVGEENNSFSFFEDLESHDRVAQVIASAGDDHLGGDDLDIAVFDLACKEASRDFMAQYPRVKNFDIREHFTAKQREELLLTIEQHKKGGIDGKLVIKKRFKIGKAAREASLVIGREEFSKALEPIYLRTKAKIDECISNATNTSYNKMVLVGGSTKLELLRERIRKDFKKIEIYCELNPDESVALGAAVQASILKGETAVQVNDVLPQSIGIDCVVTVDDVKLRGRYQRIINKDTSLPTEATIPVSTLTDGQRSANIAIYQGEDSMTSNNTYLGSIVIADLPERSAGSVDMRLSMRVDANGLLYVSVNTEGKKTAVVLKNILKPGEVKLNRMAQKMLTSMESAINNADIADDLRDELMAELEGIRESGGKIPADFQKRVRSLGTQTMDTVQAAATRHFSGRDGYLQTHVAEEDDDNEQGDDEE